MLVDSDKTQPPSQPLDHSMISMMIESFLMVHQMQWAIQVPWRFFAMRVYGLTITKYLIKSLYVSKATIGLFTHIGVEHASVMEEAYWDIGKNRLKDMVCKVSKNKPIDVLSWLSPDYHKQTSTGFLKRSRQSALNKVTMPKAGTRISFNFCNCKEDGTHLLIQRKVGEIVTATKLFSRTRRKTKDKIFSQMINQRLCWCVSNN
ncbi:hypothetical protein Cgig2_004341 [Carnegiea gigantea]|uniref:Uncharacterized protein n=1 Tax=Carnegiea gigantea TaxID=171969 RepID=A0A9Q1GLB2_9CARY|nr:hypothetical protein Cgig2_004341 [Carnegiea gigantea]